MQSMTQNYLTLLVAVIVIITIIAHQWIRYVQFKKTGIEVEGIICEMVDIGTPTEIRRYPVIQFVTKDRMLIKETSKFYIISFFKKGKKVRIIYDPENPRDFKILIFKSFFLRRSP